ncbi:hypothetical protein PMAYCL1PPCAC_00921, partial [Pristionchus mayeri]
LKMLFPVLLLLCSVAVDARVTFAKSEVLDNVDLKGVNAMAPFRCSNGCRVYSPTQSDTIAIFDGAGNQKKSLRDLSNDDGLPNGYELPGGNYQLKNTGLADQPFVFYAVEKAAAKYGSAVFYRTNTDPMLLETTATGPVTVLSTTGAVTFSAFDGFIEGYLPTVYAAGFDSIANCRAVYTPSSKITLAYSSISVHSPIATIDIKRGAFGQLLSVSGEDAQYTLASDASAVFTSPGYVGCPAIPSVGDSLYTLLPRIAGIQDYAMALSSKGLSLMVHGDYNIAKESDAIILTVNGNTKRLFGKNSISDKEDGTTFTIDFSWTKKDNEDGFAIQIDIETKQGNGPDPVATTTKSDPAVKATTPGKSDTTTSLGVKA